MVKVLPDPMRVRFGDERAFANAGVLLPAVLPDRLGIEALVDRTVDLGERAGAANPGRKVMGDGSRWSSAETIQPWNGPAGWRVIAMRTRASGRLPANSVRTFPNARLRVGSQGGRGPGLARLFPLALCGPAAIDVEDAEIGAAPSRQRQTR
jgi:hypothetical protein